MRKPQVFLSYVRADKKKIEWIYRKLAREGLKPWMDQTDVHPGEMWEHEIAKAIESADFFLACLSGRSINARGFLQKEIRSALEAWDKKLPRDIYLIPVRLEECKVPDNLSAFQWVDLRDENDEEGWNRLMEAIRLGQERRNEPGGPRSLSR